MPSQSAGMRKPEQIEETVLAGDVELDEGTVSQINALLDKREEELERLSR